MTIALANAGSTITESEGVSFNVCVIMSQDAAGGRESPIDIMLSYDPNGGKPGMCYRNVIDS